MIRPGVGGLESLKGGSGDQVSIIGTLPVLITHQKDLKAIPSRRQNSLM